MIDRIARFLAPPCGNGARDVLLLVMLAQGIGRIITGASATPINFLPSRAYGALLVLVALALLATRNAQRLRLVGRAAAAAAFFLWVVLALDVLGAWVTLAGVLVYVFVSFNELRA